MTSATTMEKVDQLVTRLLFISSIYFVLGMLLHCWFVEEGERSLTNAFYFTVVTISSIGYGDIKPIRDDGKLLVAAYCFIGPLFCWEAIDQLVSYLLMKLEVWYFKGLKERGKGIMKASYWIMLILVDLGIGVCGIRIFEGNLDWYDTIYFVCITTTTVGFGDISFKTNGGRLFAGVWLLLSAPLFMQACAYLRAYLRAPWRKISGTLLFPPNEQNADGMDGSNNSLVIGVLMSFEHTRNLKWAIRNLVSKDGIVYMIHLMSDPPMDPERIIRDASGGAAPIPLKDFLNRQVIIESFGLSKDIVHLDLVGCRKLAERKGVSIMLKIVWGDERTELLQAIKNLKIKTLVMGRRHCDFFQRMLLVRLSTFMMKNAPVPVTVISERYDSGEVYEDSQKSVILSR